MNLAEAASTGLVHVTVDVSRLGAHGLDESLEISGTIAIEGITEIHKVDESIVVASTRNNRLLALDVMRSFTLIATAVLEEQSIKFLKPIGNCSGNFFLVGSLESVAVVQFVTEVDDTEMCKFQVLCTLPTQFPICDAACHRYGNFQVLLSYPHQGCTLWQIDLEGNRKCLGEIETTLPDVKRIFPLADDSRVFITFGPNGLALIDGFSPDDAGLLHVEEYPITTLSTSVTAFVEDERKCLLATSSASLVVVNK